MSDEPLAVSVALPFRTARPRFGKIPTAMQYSGIGRSKLYELAANNPGTRKCSILSWRCSFPSTGPLSSPRHIQQTRRTSAVPGWPPIR